MAGDVDPYQAQWDLRPRIEALRTEAKLLHKHTADKFTERTAEIGIARDRAARDQFAAEQSAKSADIQVGVERRAVASADQEIAAREKQIADAERRGDQAKAEELREDVGKFVADRAAHEARARQAELDAAALREEAATHQRRVTELNVERQDVVSASTKADREIDLMDDQVRLLEQARLKYTEASLAVDDVPRRASLELEAEALVAKASAIQVDRDLIRAVVPDLPATTPGIDDDPGRLPAAVSDQVSLVDTFDDSVAEGTGDAASGDDTLGDAGLDASTSDRTTEDRTTEEFTTEEFTTDEFATEDFATGELATGEFSASEPDPFAPSDFGATEHSLAGSDFSEPAVETDTDFGDTESFGPDTFSA